MGIPHAEPSRREIRSKNYTRPGQNGVLAIDGPHTRSRAIGGKAYRQSLSHVELDESERTRGDSAMSDESQTDSPVPGQNSPNLLHHLGVKPLFPGPLPLP